MGEGQESSRGQVGSQVGKRFSQKLEEAVLQAPSQAAGERSSSPPCGAGVGGAHGTQDRNEKLPALLSRSKGHARSRARLRSQLCTQPGRRGASALTLPLCPLPGCGPGSHPPTPRYAGISSKFSLAQPRSAPFLPGSRLPPPLLSLQKSTASST